jgi:hypothetical protein
MKIIKRRTKIAKIGSWEFNTNNKMIWSKELHSIYEIEAKPHQLLISRIFTHFFQKKILPSNKVYQPLAINKGLKLFKSHFSDKNS